MNKRLLCIAELVKKYKNGGIMADIGTDHAYLPCFLVQEKSISYAYACDVAEGPLEHAKHTITSFGLDNLIETRLGSGLTPVKDEKIDVYVIAGMGGLLMVNLLDEYPELLESSIFILQANTALELLREYLLTHHMTIIDEEMVKDGKHIYEVIVAKKGEMSYDEKDIHFGPYLRHKKYDVFKEKWTGVLELYNRILENLDKNNERYQYISHVKEMIEEQLEES